MTPEEQQLIGGLFERMRALGPIEKDRDAESYIMQSVLATPDSAYKLVQSVLVQEQALEEATLRIQDLEQRIQQLEQGAAASACVRWLPWRSVRRLQAVAAAPAAVAPDGGAGSRLAPL